MKLKTILLCLGLLLAGSVNAQTRYVFGTNSYTDSATGNVWSPIPQADIAPYPWRSSTCAPTMPANLGLYKQQVVFTTNNGQVTISVPQGTYTVNVYMADPCAGTAVGTRNFSLAINGLMIDASIDIVKEAGGAQKPLIKSVTVGNASSIVMQIVANKTGSDPCVAAIEILPAIQPPTVTGVQYAQTVIGTGFVNGSVVSEGGAACPTSFVSATQLNSQCPAGSGTITVANPRKMNLAWIAATVPSGGGPVTSYAVMKGASATGTFSLLASVAGLSYIDTSVFDGQAPCYTVAAINSAGQGPSTPPVCVKVP